jgi:hypothetical protein
MIPMPDPTEIDLRKTLLELAPDSLDGVSLDDDAERTIVRLANMPLRRFQPKDLYIMLSQGVGLPYFVPLALERLEDNPQLQALSHPGDLLTCLLYTDARYWRGDREAWENVMNLVAETVAVASGAMEEERPLVDVFGDDFAAALVHFSGIHKGNTHD